MSGAARGAAARDPSAPAHATGGPAAPAELARGAAVPGQATSDPAPLLVVEDLRTHFFTRRGVVKAVDGVSFSLRAGETLALVGESGSGKSVTCLSLVRLVPEPAGRIVGGRILLDGDDLLAKSASEMRHVRGKQIAMVLQDPLTSLNPALTIGSQVSEVVRLHQGLRGPTLRARVIDALARLRIPGAGTRLGAYQHQLSGGMRQRVSSAIALSCAPRLLIADEPTTALDVTIQAQYLELLKEVQAATGVAVILVTHDFGIVAANADRVAVMYAGRIVEMGSTVQVFDRPGHPYTQALLACLPAAGLRREQLVEIGGQPPDLAQLPAGCPFAPRCSRREALCETAYPPPVSIAPGHVASCWAAAPVVAEGPGG
jgi:oligopeptide/dipeptide ABC transporter ATP-binding protein